MFQIKAIKGFLVLALAFAVFAIFACSEEETPTDPGGGNNSAKIFYVYENANGANNGSSWDDAFTEPSDAMAAATSGDQIWIAGSLYRYSPSNISIPYLTFKPGVAVYGGFSDTMTALSQRNPDVHVTTLDGNRAYHVVVGAEGAILDGVTITGGRATSIPVDDNSRGGGLFVADAAMTVANCLFRDNTGVNGAGIYVRNSTVTIDNCTLRDNSAEGMQRGAGGGLYVEDADVILTDCTLETNQATGGGGGMYALNSAVKVTGSMFMDNIATVSGGGGVYNNCEEDQSAEVTFTNCFFNGNTAQFGGGMFNRYCNSLIEECYFSVNEASDGGGAMFNGASALEVKNTVFAANIVLGGSGGAGVYNSDNPAGGGSPRFENCLMVENSATTGKGGAMTNADVSPAIFNCTIVSNVAIQGGGIYNVVANPTLENCILYFNTSTQDPDHPQLFDYQQSASVLTYTNIGQIGFESGTGNMSTDPLFVAGPLGKYYLCQTAAGQGETSACVDAGSDTAVNLGLDTRTTRTDRVTDAGQVDLGYHYQADN